MRRTVPRSLYRPGPREGHHGSSRIGGLLWDGQPFPYIPTGRTHEGRELGTDFQTQEETSLSSVQLYQVGIAFKEG